MLEAATNDVPFLRPARAATLVLAIACTACAARDAASDRAAPTQQGSSAPATTASGDAGVTGDAGGSMRDRAKGTRTTDGFVLVLRDSVEDESESTRATYCWTPSGNGVALHLGLIGASRLVMIDATAPRAAATYLATGAGRGAEVRIVERAGDEPVVRYVGDDVWLKLTEVAPSRVRGTVRFRVAEREGAAQVRGEASFQATPRAEGCDA